MVTALRERRATYTHSTLLEREVTAAWLLGRTPEALIAPWRVLRLGRAGRGAGPDVREAAFVLPDGSVLAGDVEVHLRASDFARHGHLDDPAYRRVVLHLVWEDDAAAMGHGVQPLPGGGEARTVALGALLGGHAERLRALVRLGPSGAEPCALREQSTDLPERLDTANLDALRREGQRRLAERAWRAGALAARLGWDGAWSELLDRALARSAGRRAETPEERSVLAAAVGLALGPEPLLALAQVARARQPRALIGALRGGSLRGAALPGDGSGTTLGAGRAAEVGCNTALPLLAALASAYDEVGLARDVAALVAAWPAPRPYGRTLALSALLGVRPRHAVEAQGLLHTQELWCERGGCGVCPFSASAAGLAPASAIGE